jgi:NAD(P)-dependent dehydrogenase (short-subunit alcohol dehydrogenase family)
VAKETYKPLLAGPSTGVVITGGASGLGRASAEALAAVGRPVALWDLHEDRAAEVAAEIAKEYGVVTAGFGVDVRDVDAISKAADRTRAALPSIGGILHSAGTVDQDGFEGATPESWDSGINVHLRPVLFLAQTFLEDLKAHPGGAIVAISSINATLGNAVNPIYSAGKGGMLSLVRSMADGLARYGIRINAVSPGQIYTPMMAPTLQYVGKELFTKRILLERLGEPEEIGRVVRFLLSDEASYITASEIVVDGGNISSQRG